MGKRYRYFFVLALWMIASSVMGQQRKLQNQPYADQRMFHLGFTVGLHTQDLILYHSGAATPEGEVWFAEIPSYSPGFSAGLIADLYLNRFMHLRAIPTLLLGDKNFVFREQESGEEFKTRLRNNYISVPVHLKLSADRINNYKPYILLGGYGSLELAPQKNEPLLLKPYDYGIEIGIGCDFYLPLFKLCPELKFSFGMRNVLEKDRSDLVQENLQKYPRSLSKATQRMITLSFHFE
jgi:hypothetical protein